MGSKKAKLGPKASLPFKVANKEKRQGLHIRRKKALDSTKRDERFQRRREEEKDPSLRENRLRANVPLTLERKRVWDDVDRDTGDGFGASIDVERLKRQKAEQDEAVSGSEESDVNNGSEEVDRDSMIDSASDSEDAPASPPPKERFGKKTATERATSPVRSTTSTNLDLTPEALAARFPTLFASEPPPAPKILVTTSLNSNLHYEAQLLTDLFPNSVYIPRSAHRYSNKFSVREIAAFATNRKYTTAIFLKEDQKKPTGLTIVHLPLGPTFHFSISVGLLASLLRCPQSIPCLSIH